MILYLLKLQLEMIMIFYKDHQKKLLQSEEKLYEFVHLKLYIYIYQFFISSIGTIDPNLVTYSFPFNKLLTNLFIFVPVNDPLILEYKFFFGLKANTDGYL